MMGDGDSSEFFADGVDVYAVDGNGNRIVVATAESPSWAETIAEALNKDPDAYII